MKVAIVGSGYVGLVTATCLASTGNDVVGVDIDAKKVRMLSGGESPIYEPGLGELMNAQLASGRLTFTTELPQAVLGSRILFIAVGTPPAADGSADLSGVESIVRGVARSMESSKIVVIKSTVPVGTGRRMSDLMMDLTAHPFAMVSNPEFLKEGSALEDFLRPDRVVIGTDDPEAVQLLSELYTPFVHSPQQILTMTREAAEMVKYASNAYLATRISFINEIAEICAHTGVDIAQVRTGMGADRRIGGDFLNPGVGYGGSCFPKDVQALIQVAQQNRCDAAILRSVHERNEYQKQALAGMVFERFGKNLKGKTLAVWGLAFKPDTDDVREAPAIRVIEKLVAAGAKVQCYDPKALPNAKLHFRGNGAVKFASDPYKALQKADGLIICTEWNEFRTPSFDKIRSAMRHRVIFDGRNLYQLSTMQRQRIEYHSIGRPAITPDNAGAGTSRDAQASGAGAVVSPKRERGCRSSMTNSETRMTNQ